MLNKSTWVSWCHYAWFLGADSLITFTQHLAASSILISLTGQHFLCNFSVFLFFFFFYPCCLVSQFEFNGWDAVKFMEGVRFGVIDSYKAIYSFWNVRSKTCHKHQSIVDGRYSIYIYMGSDTRYKQDGRIKENDTLAMATQELF